MTDAIREVEDNLEATEAWNGPLYDIWLEYRDLVVHGLGDHGEAALRGPRPRPGTASSTSAAASATRPFAWLGSSARPGTRTGSTSPSA